MQIIRVAEAYPPQIPMKSVTNPTLIFSPALLISTSSSQFPCLTHHISPVTFPSRNLLSFLQAKSAFFFHQPQTRRRSISKHVFPTTDQDYGHRSAQDQTPSIAGWYECCSWPQARRSCHQRRRTRRYWRCKEEQMHMQGVSTDHEYRSDILRICFENRLQS